MFLANPSSIYIPDTFIVTTKDKKDSEYSKYVFCSPTYSKAPYFNGAPCGVCIELKEQRIEYKIQDGRIIVIDVVFEDDKWKLMLSGNGFTGPYDDVWLRGNAYGENMALLMVKK